MKVNHVPQLYTRKVISCIETVKKNSLALVNTIGQLDAFYGTTIRDTWTNNM